MGDHRPTRNRSGPGERSEDAFFTVGASDTCLSESTRTRPPHENVYQWFWSSGEDDFGWSTYRGVGYVVARRNAMKAKLRNLTSVLGG